MLREKIILQIGLARSWELGIRRIFCYIDCANVVSILQFDMDASLFWVREEITQVRSLIQLDWQIMIVLESPDYNTATDKLARQAVRDSTPQRVGRQPSSTLISCLLHDVLIQLLVFAFIPKVNKKNVFVSIQTTFLNRWVNT